MSEITIKQDGERRVFHIDVGDDLSTEDAVNYIERIKNEIHQKPSKSLNDQYLTFVNGVTSEASKNDEVWLNRLRDLENEFALVGMSNQISRLTTALVGLNSESGEILDILKKVLFHGKPMTQEIKDKMEAELGDIFWYLANACMALGVSQDEIMIKNIKKLETRYPGGKFSIERSENRII